MSPKPIQNKALGDFLAGYKRSTTKGWSREAHDAKRAGFDSLTRQVLLRLGSGQTKYPDPDVMRSFAGFYGLDYDTLIANVVRFVYGASLAPSTLDVSRVARLEEEHARDRARIEDLEQKYHTLIAAFREVSAGKRAPPDQEQHSAAGRGRR